MGEVLPHGDDFGDHLVSITKKLGGVDQNCVPLSIYESRIAVEAEVAVKKNPVLQCHICSFSVGGLSKRYALKFSKTHSVN